MAAGYATTSCFSETSKTSGITSRASMLLKSLMQESVVASQSSISLDITTLSDRDSNICLCSLDNLFLLYCFLKEASAYDLRDSILYITSCIPLRLVGSSDAITLSVLVLDPAGRPLELGTLRFTPGGGATFW